MVRIRGPLSKAPRAGTSATLGDHYLRPPHAPSGPNSMVCCLPLL